MSKRLDIAVIAPEFTKRGGAERFILECVKRWDRSHALTIYAEEFNPALFDEFGVAHVEKRCLSPRFKGRHATLLNATLLPKIWQGDIARHDIYTSHLWPTHLIDLHPMVWFPHEPLRMLYDLRYSQPDDEDADRRKTTLHFYPRKSYERADKRAVEAVLETIEAFDKSGRPDRVVANSRATAQYVGEVYGLNECEVVYPGVDPDDGFEMSISPNMVLTIAQLWPHKRIRLIIEAIALLDEIELYVVGSGPEQPRLEKIAEHLGVADRVFFLTELDNHDVQILLSRCFCVVMAPVREPFGIVALEALAVGKPLVAVNEGGYTELVDETCARLVPPHPSAIAEQIRDLHEHPEIARNMGSCGRKIAGSYHWDRTAEEALHIVEDEYARRAREHDQSAKTDSPLFAMHYFMWYREGFGNAHWCDNKETGWVTDAPLLGYYSSQNGETINAHLDQFERMGIDVIVPNIHVGDAGLDQFQTNAMRRLQQLALERGSGLRIAPNICLYSADLNLIQAAVSEIRDTCLSTPNHLTISGKPVVMVLWTGIFDSDAAVISYLRNLTSGMFRIGIYTRPTHSQEPRASRGLFDAISVFSPLEMRDQSAWRRVWQAEYDTAKAATGYGCLTICPGFDDTHLSDPARAQSIRSIPRDDGAALAATTEFALQQDLPDLLFFNSFNEYHENTHIEPSIGFGDRYVELTREFIAAARARWQSSTTAMPGSARLAEREPGSDLDDR